MTPEAIKKIRELLLRELGAQTLDPVMQDEIIVRLGESIMMLIAQEVEQRIPPNLKPKLRELEAGEDNEAMQAFLESAIPGYDMLLQNVAKSVVLEYKRTLAKLG